MYIDYKRVKDYKPHQDNKWFIKDNKTKKRERKEVLWLVGIQANDYVEKICGSYFLVDETSHMSVRTVSLHVVIVDRKEVFLIDEKLLACGYHKMYFDYWTNFLFVNKKKKKSTIGPTFFEGFYHVEFFHTYFEASGIFGGKYYLFNVEFILF